MKLTKADQLQPGNNPRTITDDNFKRLDASLELHGDLGGIVWNERTGTRPGIGIELEGEIVREFPAYWESCKKIETEQAMDLF